LHGRLCFCFAQESAHHVRPNVEQMRNELRNRVQFSDFADITIRYVGISSVENLGLAAKLPKPIVEILATVYPGFDFADLGRFVEKTYSDQSEPMRARDYREVLERVDRYLERFGFRFNQISLNDSEAGEFMNQGMPFLAYVKHSALYSKIQDRMAERAAQPNSQSWIGKLELLKVTEMKPEGGVMPILISGYNGATREFLIELEGRRFWILDTELKQTLAGVYVLRL